MSEEVAREVEELIQLCLSSIKKMVHDEEEFLPYVITNRVSSKGELLGVDQAMNTEQALSGIYSILGEQAESGDLTSFAVILDVKMTNKDTGQQLDAIRIAIEHRHGDPVTLFIPYTVSEEGKKYGEMKTVPGERIVFRGGEKAAGKDAEQERQARDFIERIPEYAELHIQKSKELAGEDLHYDESCFALTDKIIEESWGEKPPGMIGVVVSTFGSFLGEAIRRLHGGHWDFSPEHGVFLRDVGVNKVPLFPFDKVRKRFEKGSSDSIAEYYENLKKHIAG